jgi:hypothetical protein
MSYNLAGPKVATFVAEVNIIFAFPTKKSDKPSLGVPHPMICLDCGYTLHSSGTRLLLGRST